MISFDPLYVFVLVGLFTPGPNVILLTASGARFGFRATIPHILGVALGVAFTSAIAGLGIANLLLQLPGLGFALRVAAFAWIIWMAWGLVRRPAKDGKSDGARPFTLIQAVLFQWVNPKVWAVALAASAGYPSGLPPVQEALRLGAVFLTLNLGVCVWWTLAGGMLAYLLQTPKAWRIFNSLMALALAMSGLAVFL